MPEGPSIVILREETAVFKGKKVVSVTGNAKIDLQRAAGKKVRAFKSWGKQFLICFDDFFLRIHLLMFGSYRINEKKNTAPRMSLVFKNGELNFYNCSIKLVEGKAEDNYDWKTDIMSDEWSATGAEKKLKEIKKQNVCDALLNQEIFAGVGNIIKNEVLFRTYIHPESQIEKLPAKKLKELIKDARVYSLQFYEWKKVFELRKNWLIYKKSECPRCKIKTTRKYMGKTNRLTCYCDNCQEIYK
ncbi:MAG TPA: DNA-formamidopyrimidine glycosylase family protein [Bacteroidia bacterium]